MQNATDEPVVIAVLGLGEAGGALSADLVRAGATVRAYDPAVRPPENVFEAENEAHAATGADLVLSVNRSTAAVDAMRAGIGGLSADAMWADLNTASPGKKRELADIASQHDVPFADVAIMAPVPGRGLLVPMLVSGPAAEPTAAMLRLLGASIDVLDGDAGVAATRKLLRSVFFKGMAAAIVEALEAAQAAGYEDSLRENIAAELACADKSTVERIVYGTYRHSSRRTDEMAAATDMLTELGVPPSIAAASRDLHARLVTGETAKSSVA